MSKSKKAKVKTKHVFGASWESIKIAPTITKDGYKKMYPWQKKMYRQLKKELFWLINAPMGSGKSLGIQFIACYRLLADSKLKVVIAVPRLNIAYGFEAEQLQFPDGKKINWLPQHNLCSTSADSNIEQLIGFLKGKASKKMLMDRVCLCTHATLVQTYQRDSEAFKNILIIIDEAHHIQYGKVKLNNDAGEIEMVNKLGDFVRYCIKNSKKSNISLGLTTATYFRGNRCPIIPEEHIKKFKRFNLPYDEYFKTMKYLKSYSFDFILFGHSFADAVKERFKKKVKKTIIWIPPVGSSYSSGNKHQDVHKIYESIAQKKNPEIVEQKDGVIRVKRGNNWIKVINLVDEKKRRKKERIIDKDHKSDNSNIDVIIALGMFKEGSNWKHAEECLIIGYRGSLVELIQCPGRLFRDKKGKTHVSIYQLLPFSLHQVKDKEKFREGLNTLIKGILASMLLEDVLLPLTVPMPKKKGEKGNGNKKRVNVRDLFVNEAEYDKVQKELFFKIAELMDTDKKAANDTNDFYKKYVKIVEKTLNDNNVPVSLTQPVADILWKFWQRSNMQYKGLDVKDINFDIIRKDENPFNLMVQYTTDFCGLSTFREFRQALKDRWYYSLEETKEILHLMRGVEKPINTMAEYDVLTHQREQPDVHYRYNEVLKYRDGKKSK